MGSFGLVTFRKDGRVEDELNDAARTMVTSRHFILLSGKTVFSYIAHDMKELTISPQR